MNAAAVNMSAPMGAASGFAGGARGYAAAAGGESEAPKEISTEQIQGMLDDNSKLIVEIIELNNQVKAGKGTAQLGELTDKLDKKRKQLNKNLMTLAKWADDSAETPRAPAPAPTPAQQQQQQMYAASQAQMQAAQYARAGMGMGQMPASMAQMQQAQMQVRYSQAQLQAQAHAQAQAQAQALAQAQYQARLNSMGAMNPYGQMGMQQQQQQQQRYVDGGMGYGAGGGMQQMHPMRMASGMPQGYADPQAAVMRAQQMGFTVGPQGYGMMPPPQAQQRLSPGAQGMQQGGAMGVSMGMPHQQQQGMSPGAQQQQQQPMMVSMPMSSMPMTPSEGPASSS